MLSRKNVAFLVVSVIAVFFIASWVTINSPSASTLPQPSMDETQRQTLPNEADNIEVVSDASIFAANPELMSAGRYPAPTLDLEQNEVAESERLLEYLRWKHNTGPIARTGVEISESTITQPLMGKTLREASLNWADYAETIKSESTPLQPWMGEQIRQASLNWADDVEMAQPEPVSADPIIRIEHGLVK